MAVIVGAGVMVDTLDVLAREDALDEADILVEGVDDGDKETDALLDTLVLLEWLKEGKGDHVSIEDALDVGDSEGVEDCAKETDALLDTLVLLE